jgi:flagellar protein FliS
MHPYASPAAYRESSVLTATPEQLVVMLYDGAGRFLRQAEAAMGEGARVHAHERLGRADAILDELLATLNKDAGQVAERLEAVYVFCKRLLVEARLERDARKVVQVRTLLADLRSAWAEIGSAR